MQIKAFRSKGSVQIKVLARDSGASYFHDEFYDDLDSGSEAKKKIEAFIQKFLENEVLRQTERNQNLEECSGVDGIYEIKPGDARIYAFQPADDVFVITNAQMKSEGRQSDRIALAEERRDRFFSENEV